MNPETIDMIVNVIFWFFLALFAALIGQKNRGPR